MLKEDPRLIILRILMRIEQSNATLDEIISDCFKKNNRLGKRDKSLITQIVFGVLRWRAQLDWMIQFFSKIKLHKLEPVVLNILRMGLYQIKYLTRIPNSAAVNTSVEMTKKEGNARSAGFVNGVLRNVIRNLDAICLPPLNTKNINALAVNVSFPEWLLERWVDRFGWQETQNMCAAINQIPPVTIRTNTLKTTRSELAENLHEDVSEIRSTPYARDGLSFISPKKPIGELEAFKKGWFQVQDEAAQLVALLLNPKPDEFILDACAGLGGKTGHLAQLMQNQGEIIALDREPEKLSRLREEMTRLGVTNVTTVVHDLNQKRLNPKLTKRKFDRIVLDAPCSGLGVMRRNPDIKWRLVKKNLERYKSRQIDFLNQTAQLIKPGGLIVYAVCSYESEESRAVLDRFLSTHSHFSCVVPANFENEKIKDFFDPKGFAQTFPHMHHLDGFTIALLKRVEN